MSDPATAPVESHHEEHAEGHVVAAPPLSALFEPAELKAFDNDDTEAGRNICKMLSLFFFYTVIVMGLSTYVTFRWVVQ